MTEWRTVEGEARSGPAPEFPELDEAARRRAGARVDQGADEHAAMAAESVAAQMMAAYARPL
ncbi:MAG TPA: hypothetical protein VNI34_06805 [Candidatus Nitrosotalea sp.]|nr:hypothetical protein [Candidatus Nitrosotalea sp.]